MTSSADFPSAIKDLVFESLSLTHDGIGVFDAADVLVYCNTNLAAMFSLPVETAIGMSFEELIRHNFEARSGILIEADTPEQWLEAAHRLRRSKTFRSFEIDRVDNRCFLVTEHTARDNTMLIFCSEITRQKAHEAKLRELNQKMTELAYRDSLTNIYNRRYFYELANIEMSRCTRRESDASLIMLDLDHFKTINERFGHEGGDVVLRESATLIGDLLRSYDIFGRLGGEEFAILLPDTDLAGADVLASRILNHLREHQYASPLEQACVTASIGIAVINDHPEDLEQLIRAADKKLFQAKREGRDKACF